MHGMENAKFITSLAECFVLLYHHITIVFIIIIIINIIIILLGTLFPLKGGLLWHCNVILCMLPTPNFYPSSPDPRVIQNVPLPMQSG
jgi:hypothetical protein